MSCCIRCGDEPSNELRGIREDRGRAGAFDDESENFAYLDIHEVRSI